MAEAVARFQEALRLEPDFMEAHNNLACAFLQQGKRDEAVAHFRHALRLRPDNADAYSGLGAAFADQGKWDEAVAHFSQALRIRPGFAEAHFNLANVLKSQGRLEEAVTHCHEALRIRPGFAEAHDSLGNALLGQGRVQEAVAHFQDALRIRPGFAAAHNNLGSALHRQGRFEEALMQFQLALRIQPDLSEAHCNLGNALYCQGRLEEAMTSFQQALRIRPDFPAARKGRAFLWLLRGQFDQGWPEFEWRWAQPGFVQRQFPQPLWDSSDLRGRTILLYAEHGLGDTIQFIRYAPLVKQRGGNVIVECQPALVRLLDGVKGIDQLAARGASLPAFDVQAPLLSLPRIFHTSLATIPATVPYLHPDPQLLEHWESPMSDVRCPMSNPTLRTSDFRLPTSDFLVGIAWQGDPAYYYDRQRSIPLAQFAPLARVPGVQLISLQKGPGTDQLKQLRIADCGLPLERQETKPLLESAIRNPQAAILDLSGRLDEGTGAFMDTAAVMKNLDLVISSDTAVPHLAGALGVAVWVALPLVPDWRWLLQREDSPWYPTMRLFRQTRDGHWEDVFDRLAEALKTLVAGHTSQGLQKALP